MGASWIHVPVGDMAGIDKTGRKKRTQHGDKPRACPSADQTLSSRLLVTDVQDKKGTGEGESGSPPTGGGVLASQLLRLTGCLAASSFELQAFSVNCLRTESLSYNCT